MDFHDNVTDPELRAALIADDKAENQGMHADDRHTCYTCQTWATDEHLNSAQHWATFRPFTWYGRP